MTWNFDPIPESAAHRRYAFASVGPYQVGAGETVDGRFTSGMVVDITGETRGVDGVAGSFEEAQRAAVEAARRDHAEVGAALDEFERAIEF